MLLNNTMISGDPVIRWLETPQFSLRPSTDGVIQATSQRTGRVTWAELLPCWTRQLVGEAREQKLAVSHFEDHLHRASADGSSAAVTTNIRIIGLDIRGRLVESDGRAEPGQKSNHETNSPGHDQALPARDLTDATRFRPCSRGIDASSESPDGRPARGLSGHRRRNPGYSVIQRPASISIEPAERKGWPRVYRTLARMGRRSMALGAVLRLRLVGPPPNGNAVAVGPST